MTTRVTPSTGPKISSSYASCPGFDVVDQRRREEEAVVGAAVAAVDDERRALVVRSMYDATLSRCSRVISGPISLDGVHAVADLHVRDALP